jgi:dTDP-4-amino-4,6-dideoxygalactose transaminase
MTNPSRLAIHGGSPVRRQFLPYARHQVDDADVAAVARMLKGDWLTQGPLVERFEAAVAAQAGARHAVAFASGTAALHAAYVAAGFGAGDEVITTPLTFAATANAAVHTGARPVFADIRPDTLTLDPDAVLDRATPRTKGLIPVDYAGLPSDYDALAAVARERGWVLVADAAHSFGGRYRERSVGLLADLTVFSFHPAKLATTAEGGAVVTDRPGYAETLRRLRHHGILYRDQGRPWRYAIETPGFNYRLSDVHCALGLSQLDKAEQFWARRAALADTYARRLAGSPFVECPAVPRESRHAWHLFVVLLRLPQLAAEQDALMTALRAEGIGVQLHYPLVHLHPFYRATYGYGPGLCPVAETVERRLMTLPLFPSMSDGDQESVLAALDKVFAFYRKQIPMRGGSPSL